MGWSELDRLGEMLEGRRLVVLSGAGVSTDSGIPDYRSPGRPQRTPIQGPAFKKDPLVRARYWSRSLVGWPRMSLARPNRAHEALSRAEAEHRVEWLITQNVDRLHSEAGSRRLTELHGALAEVVCLSCGERSSRDALQHRLLALNPKARPVGEDAEEAPEAAPDGDAEVGQLADFQVPGCLRCGGILKPDVVFFGENVPAERVEEAMGKVDGAEALLVVGSSLTVWSGYRFVRRAAERGIPVAIVNRGPTRGDPLATLKIEEGAAEVLESLFGRS